MNDGKMNTDIYTSQEAWAIVRAEEEARPLVAYRSGIPSLDNYIRDFRGGEITVISGKTGHGKTTLAISMTKSLAEQGCNCLWFSYEVGPYDFLEKSMDHNDILPEFFLPLNLIPNKLQFIEDSLKQARERTEVHALFVDHLHYLCDLGDLRMSLEIGRVMRWLKSFAVRENLHVFALAHVQKLKDVKLSELDNDHLRDSSFVAQESDNVFFVARDSFDSAWLKITKNRRKGYMNKVVKLEKLGNYLVEMEDVRENL